MKRIIISVFIAALSLFIPAVAIAASSSSMDCDSNNVISCGISNSSQLKNAAQPAGISCLYSHFGISAADINNFDSNAVAGTVTKAGRVIVNGKVVATGAITAGRQDISGSTRFSCNGHTFFIRTPSVSFASASLPSFVVTQNGQFAFAIIASCGNPVMAIPVKPLKTPVVPAPTTSPPAPTQSQTQTQTQTVTVNTPPAVQSATTTAPAATVLPNTGPGNVFALAGTVGALGALGHFFYSRRAKPE